MLCIDERKAAEMRLLMGLSWVAFALAAAYVVVGIVMFFVPNPEGWAGGIFFAVLYGVPLVLIGLALRSSHPVLHTIAGWAALLIGAVYTLIVIGNWSGYSSQTALFAVSITVPAVALDLIIFWATVLRRSGRTEKTGSARQVGRGGGI
jgi:hypothetical protein